MRNDAQLKAYITGIIFAVMVGFSFLSVKICTRVADTLQILTIRYDFAMLAVVIFMVLHLGKINMKNKPKGNLILTAGFYIGFMVFQTIGLFFSTSVESAILFAIIPIIVKVIAEVFLKEKSTLLQNIFVVISVTALIVMIVLGATNLTVNFVGVGFLLLSSLCMALNNVYMRFTRNTYTPFEITFMICFLGFVLFNVVTLISGALHGTITDYFAPFAHKEFIVATAYLGVCCILFSAQMMAYMQAHMPAVNASLFGNVSTAISIIAGVLFLGETLRWYHICCGVLIIVGAVGINLAGRKKLYD